MSNPFVSHPCSGLRGDASVPGDKSISHRALMLSSQAIGATHISGLLEGEDVLRTAHAMRALGVPVARLNNGVWEVHGVGVGGLRESAEVLDMGNAGTGARLLMGLVTPYNFATFFTGDASLRSRPMHRVISPLTQMGARVTARENGFLPLALTGTAQALPITYRLPVPSAQVKSAVLLAGLNTRGDTAVIEPQATRDHTENMLDYFGFPVARQRLEDGALSVTVSGQRQPPRQDRLLEVPGDPSSAAFLVVAALIIEGSHIVIRNLCTNPLRTGLFITLKEMGADIQFINKRSIGGEPVADMEIKYSRLRGVRVPAARAPSMIDEYPILSVAAGFAEGETVMEGLAELRVKESDRLRAIEEGLLACGVNARIEKNDVLHVTGSVRPGGGAAILTRLDHRIAMSFLVMGMAAGEPVTIDDAEAINTSFPGFMKLMNSLGARITPLPHPSIASGAPLIIAIDGPAASGKGTLARRLAAHFGLAYLDTGSLYRAVGLRLDYAAQNPHNTAAALAAAYAIGPEDFADPGLRQEHVGQAASIVSAMPEVREALLDYQRNFGKSGKGAVLDGRDIGTVVFPNAQFKFYLTASLEARARRRHEELQGEGIEVVYESVKEEIRKRDTRDQARAIAPLKPAPDAVVIDTSEMDAEEVFEKVKGMVSSRVNAS